MTGSLAGTSGRESSGARDALHSVTRGTLILLLGTLGYVGANFIARVLLVRTLTTGEFSEFYIALTLSGLITALGQLGLPQAVARSIPYAASADEQRGVVRAAFRIAIPLAIASGAVLALLALPISLTYHAPVLGLALEYFAVAIAASIVAAQIAAVFQGFEDVRPNTIFLQILNPLLFIVFLAVFSVSGAAGFPLGYTGALLAYVLATAIALGGILFYALARMPRHLPPGPVALGASRKLVVFALPLFVVGIFSFLAGALDTLLLGYFHNAETGNYGAALSLARLTLVGLGALGYILLPVVARFARMGDAEASRIVYATATKWMILTSLPLFLVFVFYPGPSLGFVYKASYAATTLPLQILVVGAFAATVIGPATAAQVSFGQTRPLLYNNLAAAGANALLSLSLIPAYGDVGAAVAWSTASALVPALSIAELAWTHGVHPFQRHYLVALLGTGIPVGALFLLLPITPAASTLVLLVLGVALVFVLVVVLTRSLDRGDRLLLEAVERMLGRPLPGARWIARHFPPRD